MMRLFAEVAARAARLTPRERLFLLGGGAVGLALIGYAFVVIPMRDRWEVLTRSIAQKERAVGEMTVLREEFLSLKREVQEAETRMAQTAGEPSILSYLEDLTRAHGVRRNIAHMRPQVNALDEQYSETVVEVRLEELTLTQAVEFLSAVEQAPRPLRVKRLQLKTRFAEPRFMDMVIHVAGYAKG